MRIKKKHIREKINPQAVAKQARDVVDAVSDELDSDDETALNFVKGMTVSEDESGIADRGIEYGVKPEPSVSDADRNALKMGDPNKKINYGEKDLPFESRVRENKSRRQVIKTIKLKDLK